MYLVSLHPFVGLPTGGDDGVRTHDPLLAGQVLSQLSYTPILGFSFFLNDHALWSLKIEQQAILYFASLRYTISPSFWFLLYFVYELSESL